MSLGDLVVLLGIAGLIFGPVVGAPSLRPVALGAVVTVAVLVAVFWFAANIIGNWADGVAG